MAARLDKPPSDLVLASASPRRKELLSQLGLRFRVAPADVDEVIPPGASPAEFVETVAEEKAMAIAKKFSESLIIGADTIVVLDKDILGKPSTAEEAQDMLARLSGRTHHVFTGLSFVHDATGRVETTHVVTDVTFGPLTSERIARYVATGEPMDKAGAYGIQGLGAVLVRGIRGCYFNVVGLPLYTVADMLIRWGYDVP